MSDDFLCETDVAFGAFGADIIGDDGFAEAGGFREADAAGDDGVEDLVAEVFPEVVGDLAGEVGAVVEHGEQDAFDGEIVLKSFADALDCVDKLGDAFERKEFALDGDDDGVGGDQGVDGEEIEGWGAIEDDEVVLGLQGVQCVPEFEFAFREVDEVDVDRDEVFIGGEKG